VKNLVQHLTVVARRRQPTKQPRIGVAICYACPRLLRRSGRLTRPPLLATTSALRSFDASFTPRNDVRAPVV